MLIKNVYICYTMLVWVFFSHGFTHKTSSIAPMHQPEPYNSVAKVRTFKQS